MVTCLCLRAVRLFLQKEQLCRREFPAQKTSFSKSISGPFAFGFPSSLIITALCSTNYCYYYYNYCYCYYYIFSTTTMLFSSFPEGLSSLSRTWALSSLDEANQRGRTTDCLVGWQGVNDLSSSSSARSSQAATSYQITKNCLWKDITSWWRISFSSFWFSTSLGGR